MLGALGLFGSIALNKLGKFGNTVVKDTYREVISDSKLSSQVITNNVKDLAYGLTNTQFEQGKTPEQEKALDNYNKGNVTTETVADPDSLYNKLFGGSRGNVTVDNAFRYTPNDSTEYIDMSKPAETTPKKSSSSSTSKYSPKKKSSGARVVSSKDHFKKYGKKYEKGKSVRSYKRL